MALTVVFRNDGTGNVEVGNYEVSVEVNDKQIYTGRIVDHRRSEGWAGLLRQFVVGLSEEKDG